MTRTPGKPPAPPGKLPPPGAPPPSDDDVVRLQKELEQLLSDIDGFEKEIASFEKYGLLPEEYNQAYVFNFEYNPVANNTKLPIATAAVNVKKGTIFLVKGLAQAYTAVGTINGTTISGPLNLPQTIRLQMIDYRLKFRDTGSDQEWQNDWVPGSLLLSGNYNHLVLREGQRKVYPGSKIECSVDAKFLSNSPTVSGFSAITKHRLQIVLDGYEIPFGGA